MCVQCVGGVCVVCVHAFWSYTVSGVGAALDEEIISSHHCFLKPQKLNWGGAVAGQKGGI